MTEHVRGILPERLEDDRERIERERTDLESADVAEVN